LRACDLAATENAPKRVRPNAALSSPPPIERGHGAQWAGIDSTTKTTGPTHNKNPIYALYYLGAILVAGYLVINIFVGVFVDSYNLAADKMNRASDSKPEPKPKLPVLYEEPPPGPRSEVCDVVTATNFDLFIAFFIVTNVLTMAFESFKQVCRPPPSHLPSCLLCPSAPRVDSQEFCKSGLAMDSTFTRSPRLLGPPYIIASTAL
jgi:hypothetical protein